jgi:hypothetical protein
VVFIVNNATVPAGGSLICAGDDQKIVLMAGDVIQVRSSAASSIDAVVSGVLNDFNRSAVVPAPPTSPVATFSITPNTTSTIEGGTVTYNVTTTNVPNGTVLYWENFGTTTALDFTDDRNDGELVITGGAGSFTRTLKITGSGGDVVGESSETIQIALQFRPGYLGGGAVAGAATVTVQPDTVVTSGLVLNLDASNPASYPGSGTLWTDLSGRGNNGTLTNGVGYSSDNGGTLVFDGVNDYIVIPNGIISPSLLASNTSFTIDMLVRKIPKSPDATFLFAHRNASNTSNEIAFIIYGDTNTTTDYGAVVGATGLSISNRGEAVSTLGYNLFTMVYTYNSNASQSVSKYRNAALVRTLAGSGTSGWQMHTNGQGGGILLGAAPNAPEGSLHSLQGNLAFLRVYNRALTNDEIAQNFSAVRGRYGI